jgi:general nucleoside transport system permease protein
VVKRFLGDLRELIVPILATILGLLVGTVFIVAAGKDPVIAYQAFVHSVVGSPRAIGETLVSTMPLIFTGLAVALAFRCGLFNIGVEGQWLVAQGAAAWAGFTLTFLPAGIHSAVTILFGMVAAALWASIAGVLKAYRGVHEVINSIMLNYTGWYLMHYVVMNLMRDPKGTAGTPAMAATAMFSQGLIQGSRLNAGLFIALAAAFVVWFFLWKTPSGYEIRAVGFAPGAAEYAGISVKRNIVLAMALSGALAGMGSAVQLLGISGKFYEPLGFVGYGFDGIAVALVGRNHPMGVVLAALLFGILDRGGSGMQASDAMVPKTIILIVQGVVIFFVAAEGLWQFMKNRRIKSEVKSA